MTLSTIPYSHFFKKIIVMSILTSLLSACATHSKPHITTVEQVDLHQFMGDWYVIAAIPTFIETKSYNAIERYTLNQDGTINTTFTFNKGSLDGPIKTYNPKGYVVAGTGNALWGMQFIWPFKSQYKIAYLDAQYSQTIIARDARDYVWIMARSPDITNSEYEKLVQIVKNIGYDVTNLRKVPHNQSKQ